MADYSTSDAILDSHRNRNDSPGEVLLTPSNDAAITVAAGATYTSPAVNLLGNGNLIGYSDVSGLGTSKMKLSIYMRTTKLKNQQQYTYASQSSLTFDPVLMNSGAEIYTDNTVMEVAASTANTSVITVNGLSLGVS